MRRSLLFMQGDLQDEITEPPPIDESTLGSGLLKAVGGVTLLLYSHDYSAKELALQ